jgi:hypothetical protein
VPEEHAIILAVDVAMLIEAEPIANAPAILLERLLERDAQMLSQTPDLFFTDPHIPRPAGTAMATLLAGEMKALGIPRLWILILDDVEFHSALLKGRRCRDSRNWVNRNAVCRIRVPNETSQLD